jgi:hypothetical protein
MVPPTTVIIPSTEDTAKMITEPKVGRCEALGGRARMIATATTRTVRTLAASVPPTPSRRVAAQWHRPIFRGGLR